MFVAVKNTVYRRDLMVTVNTPIVVDDMEGEGEAHQSVTRDGVLVLEDRSPRCQTPSILTVYTSTASLYKGFLGLADSVIIAISVFTDSPCVRFGECRFIPGNCHVRF